MQMRQMITIASLLILFTITSTGCTTTYLQLKAWEGRKISDLYFEWGKADEIGSAQGYYQVHTWISKRKNDGKEKTCRKSFYTKYDGHDEEIVKTSYSGCLFLTAQ